MAKVVLTILAALAALAAALLWYKAAASEVTHEQGGKDSIVEFMHDGHSWDPILTAEVQAKWNKRAALAACCSAVLQSAALVVPGTLAW